MRALEPDVLEVLEKPRPDGRGQVVPLFRGAQASERPLAQVAGGLWTKRQVAEWLQVSDRTVERWQLREGLPHLKPFGAKGPVRYDAGQVRAWWESRCVG